MMRWMKLRRFPNRVASRIRPGAPRTLLAWLSGTQADIVNRPGERAKIVGIGSVIVTIAVLAGISMFFALDRILGLPLYLALLLALAWGIIVVWLGRWLAAFPRQDAKPKYFVVFAPRALLALVLGFIIATSLILPTFQHEMVQQIAVIQQRQDLNAARMAELAMQVKAAKADVAAAQVAKTQVKKNRYKDAELTRLRHRRDAARARGEQALAAHYQTLITRRKLRLNVASDQAFADSLSALSSAQLKVTSERQKESHPSISLRLQALGNLPANGLKPSPGSLLLLIFLVLMLCLLLPMRLSLVTASGNTSGQSFTPRRGAQRRSAMKVTGRRKAALAMAEVHDAAITGTPDSLTSLPAAGDQGLLESDIGPKPTPVRHLTGDMPERAPAGQRISLLVRITLAPDGASAPLKPLSVPPEGRDVTITVSAPDLVPRGDLEQDMHVPPAADSEPIRFSFMTGPAGLHSVLVRAFAGGTFLGELRLQISVEPGAALEEGASRTAVLPGLTAEPGEVTLQVSRTDDDRYSFQLIAETWHQAELTRRLAGDPREVVADLVEELRAMAAGRSPFSTQAGVRNRIKNLGAQLWADAVPEAIRRQFWAQADRIKLFTVASDMDTVPWELLYPVDGANDNGFLVEQFPVVRRVYGQGRARRLPLASAAYIVPPGSPGNALEEVGAVRSRLGAGIDDHGVVQRLDALNELLENPPSLLHFACHNQFTDRSGSVITLEDGPVRPGDLSVAALSHGLAEASPLVFLNACRTAGEIPGLTHMMGWAKYFMNAGAGAFLGSLWAVRSSSARAFSDAFYEALVTQRAPLGDASLQARRAIADDGGDPTWLAYTVYGNPSATIADDKRT